MNMNKLAPNLKKRPGQNEQTYFGRGKLLLSGEYFVLDGASALVLPTKLGQSMTVRYSPSFNPKLHWKSFDSNNDLWLSVAWQSGDIWLASIEWCPNSTALQRTRRNVC